MTKENRKEVTVHGYSELQVGDRISFKATLGEETRMNTSFTFGSARAGYLRDPEGRPVVDYRTFLKNINGWDNTEWHVWRAVTKTPTEVGSVIYVEKLVSSNAGKTGMAGLAVLRGSGSWEFVRYPHIKFGASNIERWYDIDVDLIDPKN